MSKIDSYLNSICYGVGENIEEIKSLKIEMKSHIEEKINELKKEGYSENESFKIAIEEFGDFRELKKEFYNVLDYRKNSLKIGLLISIVSFSILLIRYLINNQFNSIEKGEFLIISITLLMLYTITKCVNAIRNKVNIDIKFESLNIIFILTTFFLAASIIFPINIDFNMQRGISVILGLENLGISIFYLFGYIVLGVLIQYLYPKFRSLSKYIRFISLIVLFYFFMKLIKFLFGMQLIISLSSVFSIVFGTLLGFFVFKFIKNKHIFHQSLLHFQMGSIFLIYSFDSFHQVFYLYKHYQVQLSNCP